jgi:hypothetical protein
MGPRQYTDSQLIRLLISCRLPSFRERYAFNVQTLRSLERSLDEIYLSIKWLNDRMQARLNEARVAPSAINDLTDLGNLEEDLASSKRELTYHIRGLIEEGRTRLEYYNTNQAENLSRLTILATCLLPLSISATVLSMQTRFADLDLLLYDLLGVTFLLGLIALSMFLVSEKILAIDGTQRLFFSNFDFGRVGLKASRMLSLYVWILLLTVSFLVGMLKSATVGLQVLGYEVAGASGFLGLLATLQYFTQ